GVELDDPDRAEIGAVGEPQPAIDEQEGRVDRVVVLDPVARRDGADLVVLEVGRVGIEAPGPHDLDLARMTAVKATAANCVGDVIAIADADHVGRHSAAGADGAARPGPAIRGDQPAAAGAEGVPLAVRLDDGRRVVDEDVARELCGRGRGPCQGRGGQGGERRVDRGAPHRTTTSTSRIGCPLASSSRRQKSLRPGPLMIAPWITLRPLRRVSRSDSTSSITIRRSSNSSAATSPLSHQREAELEPTARRTSVTSRGLSITVTAQKTTP